MSETETITSRIDAVTRIDFALYQRRSSTSASRPFDLAQYRARAPADDGAESTTEE